MRLILSRKGFDSAAGGCPSPILPNGQLLSLPIPDAQSRIRFRDVNFGSQALSKWVNNLTRNPRMAQQGAHLDPDLRAGALPSRHPQWRGVLGQHGAAQSHLNNENVQTGDLFLFFGLFRPIEMHQRRWRFIPGSPSRHVIWGWLQIGDHVPVDACPTDIKIWAEYHPHFQYTTDPSNTLYIGTDRLSFPTGHTGQAGFGVFDRATRARQLTAPDSPNPSLWQLPGSFFPTEDEPALSYHRNPERWFRQTEHCQLRAAARGQEFVLGPSATQRSKDWILSLFNDDNCLYDRIDS